MIVLFTCARTNCYLFIYFDCYQKSHKQVWEKITLDDSGGKKIMGKNKSARVLDMTPASLRTINARDIF